MKYITAIFTFAFLFPLISFAQSTTGLQGLFANTLTFIFETLVPFLFGIAFLFFVVNAIRFFVIGGSNEEGQKKAKSLALYSVAAFVFLIIFYGLVNILAESTGLETDKQPCSDYLKDKGLCNDQ